jgi:hypothetical protein
MGPRIITHSQYYSNQNGLNLVTSFRALLNLGGWWYMVGSQFGWVVVYGGVTLKQGILPIHICELDLIVK